MLVRQWLERPGCRIKQIFLPAYAPHLNAIERLWGVMHREVTHNCFYASFAQFTEAIDDFFTRRLPREWTIWRDTITIISVSSHTGSLGFWSEPGIIPMVADIDPTGYPLHSSWRDDSLVGCTARQILCTHGSGRPVAGVDYPRTFHGASMSGSVSDTGCRDYIHRLR